MVEINGQVSFKEKLRNCTQIRMGTVISFEGENNELAVVSVIDDPKKPRSLQASSRKRIPVKDLTPTKKLFGGRAVVHANPAYRTIGSLILNNR
jgi:hypothetical protein